MINHISIAVNDPKKVADVLAEIWDGVVYPFPPSPNSFIVLANDGKGSAVGQKMGVHDFTSADVQKMSDAELTDVITKGKNKMPAYAGKLQESDIKGLVAYIRQLGKGK